MQSETNRLDKIYKSEIITLPHVKIASNRSTTFTDNAILHENGQTSPFKREDDAVISFYIDGRINSQYGGIAESFNVRSRTCTFVYGPQDNEHRVCANQQIDSIAVGINKKFFYNLLQDEDKWLEAIINKIEQKQPFSLSKGAYTLTPHMFAVLHKIRNTNHTGSMRTLQLQGLVNELVLLQFQELRATDRLASTGLRADDRIKLAELKSYIDSNFLEELSLDSLARTSGLNTFKIKTGFKELYAQTTFEYIRSLRMEHAASLLLDGGYTITEVSDIVGYVHVQHFSSAFKKHFGTSPGAYKY